MLHVAFDILGSVAVITHSQSSWLDQRKLCPISNIPFDEVSIFDPQDYNLKFKKKSF